MPKQVIACFYVPGIILVLIAMIVLVSASNDYTYQLARLPGNVAFYQGYCSASATPSTPECIAVSNIANDINTMRSASVFFWLGGLLILVAWIGALMNLGKAQEWTWFLLIFFLGVVMLAIYLKAGPRPPAIDKYPRDQQISTSPHPSSGVPSHPSGQTMQSPSALEILQQRYARGEIDTATFHQINEQLGASNPLD